MAELVDVDLDALAPVPKRATLGGKTYKLPGDMPLELFFRVQSFEQRVSRGESEMVMLEELRDELLALFRVYQPQMKALPSMGVLTLLQSLGAIYGGGLGEAAPTTGGTSLQRKRTGSAQTPASRRRTSR